MSLFAKHAFGLDISDSSVEILEIKKQLGKLKIFVYGRKKLDSSIVENGRIKDKKKLIEVIEDLLLLVKPKHLKTREVVLSIPESKTFIHVFRLPAVISS